MDNELEMLGAILGAEIPDTIVYRSDLDRVVESVSIKSDWNENNTDSLAYIENRTHYVETRTELIDSSWDGDFESEKAPDLIFGPYDDGDIIFRVYKLSDNIEQSGETFNFDLENLKQKCYYTDAYTPVEGVFTPYEFVCAIVDDLIEGGQIPTDMREEAISEYIAGCDTYYQPIIENTVVLSYYGMDELSVAVVYVLDDCDFEIFGEGEHHYTKGVYAIARVSGYEEEGIWVTDYEFTPTVLETAIPLDEKYLPEATKQKLNNAIMRINSLENSHYDILIIRNATSGTCVFYEYPSNPIFDIEDLKRLKYSEIEAIWKSGRTIRIIETNYGDGQVVTHDVQWAAIRGRTVIPHTYQDIVMDMMVPSENSMTITQFVVEEPYDDKDYPIIRVKDYAYNYSALGVLIDWSTITYEELAPAYFAGTPISINIGGIYYPVISRRTGSNSAFLEMIVLSSNNTIYAPDTWLYLLSNDGTKTVTRLTNYHQLETDVDSLEDAVSDKLDKSLTKTPATESNKIITEADISESSSVTIEDNELVVNPSTSTIRKLSELSLGDSVFLDEDNREGFHNWVEYYLVENVADTTNYVVMRKDTTTETKSMTTAYGGWSICSARTYLNSETGFLSRFKSTTKDLFGTKSVKYVESCNSNENQYNYCEDTVFLPSVYELHGSNTSVYSPAPLDGDTDWQENFEDSIVSSNNSYITRTKVYTSSWYNRVRGYSADGTQFSDNATDNYLRPCIVITGSANVDENNHIVEATSYEAIQIDTIRDENKIYKIKDLDARAALENKQDALVFNTPYGATTNKVATMADLTKPIEISDIPVSLGSHISQELYDLITTGVPFTYNGYNCELGSYDENTEYLKLYVFADDLSEINSDWHGNGYGVFSITAAGMKIFETTCFALTTSGELQKLENITFNQPITVQNKGATMADLSEITVPPEVHIGTSAPTGEEILWVDTDEDEEPDDVATKSYVDSVVGQLEDLLGSGVIE